MTKDIQLSAKIASERANELVPKVGIVLGSGLGPFADTVEGAVTVPYSHLPGFPEPGVGGHAGQLVLGTVGGTSIAVMQGRAHFYEEGNPAAMKTPIRVLAEMGCDTLLLTNAAGSLNWEAAPGAVMMITDYLNMTGTSPLFGEPTDSRFVDMVDCLDLGLQDRFREAAKVGGITLHEGVYAWMPGPQFETRAEIKMLKTLGADAVGMSTVPEIILARHMGLKVAALSIITNLAAGMEKNALSHTQTKEQADQAGPVVQRLLTEFLTGLGENA